MEGAVLWREKGAAGPQAAHLPADRPRPLGGPRRGRAVRKCSGCCLGLRREEAPAGAKGAGHGLRLRRSLARSLPLQAPRGFVVPSPAPFLLVCVTFSPLSLECLPTCPHLSRYRVPLF